MIDEDAEERAIHSGFPIGIGEEDVGGFAAEFKRDALEGVRGALDDDFADGGAAGEGDFVHAGMGDEGGASGFAKAVDDIDNAGWKAGFLEPIGHFERGERGLLGGFEDAGAAGGERGSELPRGHEEGIVPGDDLAGDADRLAQSEAESIGGNGVDVAENFVGEAGIVFEAGGHVGDIKFGFHDGLAGIAGFEFGEGGGIGANFFGEFVEQAAAVLRGRGGPGAGVEGGAGGGDGGIDIGGGRGGDLRDDFFGGGIVDGESFARGAGGPLVVDEILAGLHGGLSGAGHEWSLRLFAMSL